MARYACLLAAQLVLFLVLLRSDGAAAQSAGTLTWRGGLRGTGRLLMQGGPGNPEEAAAPNTAAGAGGQVALLGCNNMTNPQCDTQCETCQPDGSCAPHVGSCGAGPEGLWAGVCTAGRCQPTGCNNPDGPVKCNSQCETCMANGTCAEQQGPCKYGTVSGMCSSGRCQPTGCNSPTGPKCSNCETCGADGSCTPRQGACLTGPYNLWEGTCAAGSCVANGCNNPEKPQCDGQCETCQDSGRCEPRAGSCWVNGRAGTCADGRCKEYPTPPPPSPAQQPPPPPPSPAQPSPPPPSPPAPPGLNGFTPFGLGVTNTHGQAPRYVILTWIIAPQWLDEVVGFQLTIWEEETAPAPADSFVLANGWNRTVIKATKDLASRSLRRVDVGTPPYETRYRLTLALPAPTMGRRVKVELASAAGDGTFSPPAEAYTKPDIIIAASPMAAP